MDSLLKHLSVYDAAMALRLSLPTVYRFLENGKLTQSKDALIRAVVVDEKYNELLKERESKRSRK